MRKKWDYQQRGINYVKEPNRNSGDKKYNIWNPKFTRGVQEHNWADRKQIRVLEGRKMEIIDPNKTEETKGWKVNRT